MQQHLSQALLQQLEAALTKISATSSNLAASEPGGMFSAVAVKLPKPIPRCCSSDVLGTSESTVFWGSPFFDAWVH